MIHPNDGHDQSPPAYLHPAMAGRSFKVDAGFSDRLSVSIGACQVPVVHEPPPVKQPAQRPRGI
jgi:hypothetical protein